jgi:hypothetical protein
LDFEFLKEFRICRFGFIVVVDVEKEMKLKGER